MNPEARDLRQFCLQMAVDLHDRGTNDSIVLATAAKFEAYVTTGRPMQAA